MTLVMDDCILNEVRLQKEKETCIVWLLWLGAGPNFRKADV